MADTKAITTRLTTWLKGQSTQPLLLTGLGAESAAASFIASLDAETEVLQLSGDEPSIKVKEVRALLARLHHTALTDRRVVVLFGAERLLPASANALLKELEETGKQNRFLLVTAFPGRLLATIRSRCQVVRVSAEVQSTVAGQLPAFDPKRKTPLTPEEVTTITLFLQHRLAADGPTPQVRRSFLRLRDYYKIQALRGNVRLAGDVLLASLPNLQDT